MNGSLSSFALIMTTMALPSYAAHADECAGPSAHIIVATDSHKLRLCEGGRVARAFGVRLGRGGVGKKEDSVRYALRGMAPASRRTVPQNIRVSAAKLRPLSRLARSTTPMGT